MEDQPKRELSPEQQETLARFEEEMRRMTVGDHLATILQSLAALAVRKIGMAPEMSSERDLDQAKLAIEAFKALLPVAEPVRPEQEMQVHRGMLSELQMVYVTALRQEQGEEAPAEAPAEEPAGEEVPSEEPAASDEDTPDE